jgi:hypothetical protein
VLACACTFQGGALEGRPAVPTTPAPQDTVLMREAARLIHASPVLWPPRGGMEAVFVREVRLLAPRVGRRAEEIRTVDDAMAVLESVTEQRIARIRIMSPRQPLDVQIRRWSERRNPNAWVQLRADTLIWRPAVLYQFLYRPAGAGRDTVVQRPCADDCDVALP